MQSFLKDTQDFFSARCKGHMGLWRYSEPAYSGDPVRGMQLWAEFVKNAKAGNDYYCYTDEVSVIRKSTAFLNQIVIQPCRLVDLGPGSTEAFDQKPSVYIEGMSQISNYTGFDITDQTLETILQHAKMKFPKLDVSGVHGDFYATKLPPSNLPTFAVFFGQTMMNLPIDPFDRRLVQEKMVSSLRSLKCHLQNSRDFLVVTHDVNQDAASLNAAYATEAAFNLNLLERIKRDLPVTAQFDPQAFSFDPYYVAETGALSHTYVAQKDMSFDIGAENFSLSKGQRFFMHNTYKISAEDFQRMAVLAGYIPMELIMSDNNRCALHVLKA